MCTRHPDARFLPLAVLFLAALGGCRDAPLPTTPAEHASFTQVTSNPVVNSLADPGVGTCDDSECTLREAIAFAGSGATITFSVTGTITLSGTQLSIYQNLTISGPGATELTVTGNGVSRVFVISSGDVIITGLTITGGNTTTGGAGILVSASASNLTVVGCAITGNNAGFSAGGGIRNLAALVVVSSTISGNTGHSSGAGVDSYTPTSTTLLNSTISGNHDPDGYPAVGIHSSTGLVRVVHSTVTGHSYGVDVSQGTVQVKGSVIWGNTVDDITESSDGLVTSLGYNLIGTAGSAGLLAEFSETGDQTGVADAYLVTLALNSPGGTATHALLTSSPAINASTCTDHAGVPITTDQRGVSRPQGSACDIGAYELLVSGGATPEFDFDLSALPAKTYGDANFNVSSYATTNSTGAITFAAGIGSAGCSVTNLGTVTITGAAVDPSACIVEATLAPDATYAGAGPIQQSFNIAKAAGSVTINNIPASASVGGSFTPAYTKAGNGTASTVSNSTGVCTVTSGVVDFTATGTCLLQASVTEGTNHLAATGSEQSFAVSMAIPTFAFDLSGLPAKTYGDVSFSVASYATTNSTGAITFATGTGSMGCSVTTEGEVTIIGAAADPDHCILAATLASGGTYQGAGPIEQSFNIAKAPGSVSINNMPSAASVGGQFTPTYAMPGDGTASTNSLTTGVCTVAAGVVSFIAPGTCTLQASVTDGANYLGATGSGQSVTVDPVFTPSCTYTINEKNDQRQVTVSWENADPGVTLIEVMGDRRLTKQLAPAVSGSWSTKLKTGVPTYGLWGGTSRKDAGTVLVPAGTACTGPG